MNMREVEAKWQKIWEEQATYKFDWSRADKKCYVLEMFSYPSGAKLHVGHWYNYGPSDSYARFKRMQGYEVFQPMGFDAFGLPAENYAIKTGIHPKDSTLKNIATMEKQLKAIGATYDWDYEVVTCDPSYYKWTQWLFLQLYNKGLAYRKEAPVNWCVSCNTVLANEQVVDGCCERCGAAVIRKNLTQWFFKITDYAEELLNDLDKLDWPEKTKLMQKHWIGKSSGGEIEFKIKNSDKSFKAFTTRADTLFGVSYVVLAPENSLVEGLTTPEQKEIVESYKQECSKINEIERLSSTREKTGVFTGSYAVNPINGREVPVYIADYVLASYGTGAVMGVPSHDERDFVFAQKHGLSIERVIKGTDGNDELPFCDYGVMVNSGEFDGLLSEDGIKAVLKKLAERGLGGEKVNYRLRDWLVSRQRYWGAPIPVIHCGNCGIVPVPEKDLPVELPYNVDFTPDGVSPLLKSGEFMNTVCPVCGAPAKRDPDTLDTFVCSSWYYLRYADPSNGEQAFDKAKVDKLLPVDKYIGGAEHACMHLLYARFIIKALRDMGYLDFDEPFKSLVHQGTILGPDGNKMSKSHGNVISPDALIEKYGADAFRVYLMFGFSYVEGGPWNDNGLESIQRFMDRVERLVCHSKTFTYNKNAYTSAEKELDYRRNYTIKHVTADTEVFAFNTALARIMELTNALTEYEKKYTDKNILFRDCVKDLILLIAPFAPHFAEELWEISGGKKSVFRESYPVVDESALTLDEVELAVQINSRVKTKIVVPNGLNPKEIEALALKDENILKLLDGQAPKKIIVIPKRLINFVL